MTFLIGILAIIIGAAFCFAGFRFFLLLLPLWGFFIGFNVGTDVITAIFGDGSFATLLSWAAGFIVAIAFAVLSYLWYWLAVVILAGGLGYAAGTAVWGAIFGTTFGFVGFVLGLVVAVVLAGIALVLNVPKYLVVILTAAGGAVTVIAGWLLLIGKIPSDQIHWSVVGEVIKDSWFYLFVYLILAVAGIIAQSAGPAIGPSDYEFDQSEYRYS
jgi:hypothetical protein